MKTTDTNEHLKPVLFTGREGNSSDEKRTDRKQNFLWLWILIPLVLIAAVWIWKQVEINNIKKTAAKEQAALIQTAKKEIVANSTEHLRLLAKPFVWALRTEMLQGNLGQVHLYLNEMVKEHNFKNVAVANSDGKIVSSTNKKFEGQPFAAIGDNKYLSINNTVVENNNDSLLTMASPIMGFDKRLGTLFVTYQLAKSAL